MIKISAPLDQFHDSEPTFQVKFWGVRGSIPCPGQATVKYGGNTTCVEMQIAGTRLIFDAGTGIRLLGEAISKGVYPQENGDGVAHGHLFFTHTHWDHIQGFPFFAPAFKAGNDFQIYGVPIDGKRSIQQRLHEQMLHPNFPVPLQTMQGITHFHDLSVGERIALGEIVIDSRGLHHPGGSVGYRVEWRGLSAAFITDTEHFADRLDPNVLALADNVNVLILDATYTDDEYHHSSQSKVGWGHSTGFVA